MTNKSILPIITISCGLFFSTAALATDNNDSLTPSTTSKTIAGSAPGTTKSNTKPVKNIKPVKKESTKKQKTTSPQKATTPPTNTYTPYTPTPTSQYGDQYHD